jgi:hypothetical protein
VKSLKDSLIALIRQQKPARDKPTGGLKAAIHKALGDSIYMDRKGGSQGEKNDVTVLLYLKMPKRTPVFSWGNMSKFSK